jgi:glycine hydroxymethyltransferase
VFPGLQGTPLLHVLAGKAVCLGEALKPEFRAYAAAVLANARAFAARLQRHGYTLVGGGTDTPLMLVDLREQNLAGEPAAQSLDRAGLTCNANPIPTDTKELKVMSGLRFGASACTTRGFGVAEFEVVGDMIAEVLGGLRRSPADNSAAEQAVWTKVRTLTARFPIYS